MIPIDFEALFARSPNPYVVLDASLTIAWMNDAYLRVTMRERDAIVGRKMFDAFPSDPTSESGSLLRQSFARVLATGEADEIAIIRYDIEKPDGGMDVRYWSATHTPMHDASGNTAYILQHTVDVTELHGLRRLRDEMGVVQRAGAIQERNRRMSQEVLRLRSLVEQAPGFVAIVSEPEHIFRLANQAYRRLTGERELIGRSVREAIPEVVEQGFVGVLDEVRESGTAYVSNGGAVLLANAEGRIEERRLDFIFQPIFGLDGQVTGIFIQGYDVTEQHEAQERQRLLINELNHRVKNTLAIVQSLATQSFRHVSSAEAAQRVFQARLNALAAAHSLLTASNWESAHLLDTVRASVAATAGEAIDRFRIDGPNFSLQPQTAVSLAMIIHELSTNAIKYGALSTDDGRVDVSWSLQEEDGHCRLWIDWVEAGGPAVIEPERRGFGTRLIERGMSAERDSAVTISFKPDGVRCSISAILPRAPA